MNKYANQYLKDLAAQLAIKSQIKSDRPIANMAGHMGGRLVSGLVTAPLTMASGGALGPISSLIDSTAGSIGGRMATVGSGPEGRGQVENAAKVVKDSSYKDLLKRQIKHNILKNLAIDTPLGALAGGALGFMYGKQHGGDGLSGALGGAAIGGLGALGLTQAGNVISPGIRKLLANYADDKSMQRASNYVSGRPVVSNLPFNELVAPVAAKEFQ